MTAIGPFEAIIEMCDRLGVQGIGSFPGCWEYEIDKHWWVAVNGHTEPVKALSPTDVKYDRPGTDVPPFTAYVEFNGWPAGLIDPTGGVLAAGAAANEATFIEACAAVTA
jgi:hypothetical protein